MTLIPTRRATARTRGILAAVLALLVAVALGGCRGAYGISAGAARQAPSDKVLRLSFLEDPGQPPDPDIYYSEQGLQLTTNAYEGLIRYKGGTATPTFEAALATKWSASANNTVFRFTLRKGVKFHDGTTMTSAAVKPSFDRRLAVNQGPAYMVADVKSVQTPDPYSVVITLKSPNSSFLAYLASPYGPKIMSPTGLAKHAGTDHAETYLTTHDLGTGAYTLSDARVGVHYAMTAFDDYWGGKPYFRKVDFPVITDTSSQQLQFNSGQLAAVLGGLPSSAVQSYISSRAYASYTLPSMQSMYLYTNANRGVLKDAALRRAILAAVDVDAIVKGVYRGRGTKATQIYPPNMMPAQYAQMNITYDTSKLQAMVKKLPSGKRSITVGYDSSLPDGQLTANLVGAQLSAVGLKAQVLAYPTAQIFGWVGNGAAGPDVLVTTGWPDAPPPYTWAHISFDPDGGLNYLQCSSKPLTQKIAQGVPDGSSRVYSEVAKLAVDTGCWMNLVAISDFMVTQPWLKGVEQAHIVSAPGTLTFFRLSAGDGT